MRSVFKRYKLLKLAMGEEKVPEEGVARDRWIEKSAVLYDLILQSINNNMFQHIKDLVELDDSGPKAWKLLHGVIQPNTLPMVIVLEKELAALSMRPGDDVKPVLDKIRDTYARMAAAGSNVSQMQQCTKIISVLDNSWDNLIPTLNTQQDQWTPEWLRQHILHEDFRRRHTGGGAANKIAEGYGAAGGSRGRGGGRGRGRGRGFGRGRGRGDYNKGHGSSGRRGSTRMEVLPVGAPWVLTDTVTAGTINNWVALSEARAKYLRVVMPAALENLHTAQLRDARRYEQWQQQGLGGTVKKGVSQGQEVYLKRAKQDTLDVGVGTGRCRVREVRPSGILVLENKRGARLKEHQSNTALVKGSKPQHGGPVTRAQAARARAQEGAVGD
ncbi:unnamed protein product [Closterium sp. NIES-53]